MEKQLSLTLPKLSVHFGLVVCAIVVSLCVCSRASSSKRPNVLFIMSDDHTSQAISAYGGILADVCPTPHIDRLAKEGMLFENCFVTNSICTPSRAAIMTGKYAHKNGVYKFTAMDQAQPTLPKYMQQAGYHTSLIGKYHLYSNPVGLDYFSVLPGQGRYHNPDFIAKGDESRTGRISDGKRTVFQGHSSDVIADQALDFLKHKRPKDEPFLFFCHFKAPHDTWEFAERYRDFLADVEIPEPPNLFDDYEGRSDMLRKQLQYIGSDWGNHTNFRRETRQLTGKAKKEMQYQLYMKKYLRCVKGVDDNVGRILDYLDESGLAENTLVMYTGDQGFFLGEHSLYDKRIMYEEALRMPFLARWPSQIKPGSTSAGMILNVDFAPTIMAAAGLPTPTDMQGRSFLPLLNGELPPDWRKSMYYRYYYSHFETESHYGVRTYQHKLIYFDRIKQWELYDLEKDPHEMNNVYDDPQYKQVVQELKRELKRLQTELEDDPEDVGDNPRMGRIAPTPLYVAERDLPFARRNVSILARFKTEDAGTIFARCPPTGDYEDGSKMLFFRGRRLIYDDSWEDPVVPGNYCDNQWHTVAVVYRGKEVFIYVDGEQRLREKRYITDDVPGHVFKIGAGAADHGANFGGKISDALYYDEALAQADIERFARGDHPSVRPVMAWPKQYEATWESLSNWECPQWFQDAVLGVYVHWSPGSVPGFPFELPSERVDSGIWYGGGIYGCYTEQGYNANPRDPLGVYEFHTKTYGDPERFGYPYLIDLFKAEKWNPDEWAELFKHAGCDYAGLAAEHGDGYPMYNSSYDSINAFNTGPKRDITKELFAAVRKQGMMTVATVHEHPGSLFGRAWEFAPADSQVRDPKYRDLFKADTPEVYTRKIYELMETYQPDQLWIDNPILRNSRRRWLKFVSDYYNKGAAWGKGGTLISQKGRSERLLQHTILDIEGGEFPGGKWAWRGMKEPYPKRWQKDVPIGNYWAYAEGVGCRPVNMLVDGIVDRISKNGVTFLDLAPKGDGTFPEAQIKGMRELGDWMKHNKEALYAARPAPFKAGGVAVWQAKGGTVRFTEKGDYLYAIDLGNIWPTKRGFADYEESTRPTAPYTLPGVKPVAGSEIIMLGSNRKLPWKMEGNDLVIMELPDPLPCDHAWSFKIKVAQ